MDYIETLSSVNNIKSKESKDNHLLFVHTNYKRNPISNFISPKNFKKEKNFNKQNSPTAICFCSNELLSPKNFVYSSYKNNVCKTIMIDNKNNNFSKTISLNKSENSLKSKAVNKSKEKEAKIKNINNNKPIVNPFIEQIHKMVIIKEDLRKPNNNNEIVNSLLKANKIEENNNQFNDNCNSNKNKAFCVNNKCKEKNNCFYLDNSDDLNNCDNLIETIDSNPQQLKNKLPKNQINNNSAISYNNNKNNDIVNHQNVNNNNYMNYNNAFDNNLNSQNNNKNNKNKFYFSENNSSKKMSITNTLNERINPSSYLQNSEFYPSIIYLNNPNFPLKNINNNNNINNFIFNKNQKNSNSNFSNKQISKSTSNFFSAAEAHRRNVSSNTVLKKPDTRVLSRIDKLYSDLKAKEQKLENFIEPFLSRNRIKINKDNEYLGHMKNLKNSIAKKDQDITIKDSSFVKINIYNSLNNNNNYFDKDDNDKYKELNEERLSPNNANFIFSNKLILNNLNEQNFNKNNTANQKIILLPANNNSNSKNNKKFGFYSAEGSFNNNNKNNFNSFNNSSKGKFFHKEIKIAKSKNKNKNENNQMLQLDSNYSSNIFSNNNKDYNKNFSSSNNNNKNTYNFFHKFHNTSTTNFHSSLKDVKPKQNSLKKEEDNDFATEENANFYLNSNYKNKDLNLNKPKRRNLSEIPSSTRTRNLNKALNQKEDSVTGHKTNEENLNGKNESESSQDESEKDDCSSVNNNSLETDKSNSNKNVPDSISNETNIQKNHYKQKSKINIAKINKKYVKEKNHIEKLQLLNKNSQNNISVSICFDSENEKENKNKANDSLNSSKSTKTKKNEKNNKKKNKTFSSCKDFNKANKTKSSAESAAENPSIKKNLDTTKALNKTNTNQPLCGDEGKKYSNFATNVNLRSQSQKSKFPAFEHLNQDIENIYDIKIDAKYDKNFESKVAKIDSELQEHKYFDNIKFNYMVKNFQRFKDFIQKPPVIIRPVKTNSVPLQIFNGELKVGILKKLKNAMLKKEIQK